MYVPLHNYIDKCNFTFPAVEIKIKNRLFCALHNLPLHSSLQYRFFSLLFFFLIQVLYFSNMDEEIK